jgi:cardiolipin synthase A/B
MRIRSLFYTWFFWLCFIQITWSQTLIIEPEMGRQPLIDALNATQESLALAMYGFTDEHLLKALLAQQTKGKTLEVILERSPYKAEKENSKTIAVLESQGISWQGSIPPLHLVHEKMLLIDKRKAIIMTFNFTHATFKNERNFALIIDDPQQVAEINATFSADFHHTPLQQVHSIILSPYNSRGQLLKLIREAKESIQIYTQQISDYQIVGALAQAARSGVTIDILTSSHLKKKQAHYLKKSGVHVHYSQGYWIHAKVMIIDHKQALIGSINFTPTSLDSNRELAVITKNPAVIQQLGKTFTKDCNASRG